MVKTKTKLVVSVVSYDIPLNRCPLGTTLFIKRDTKNAYDKKAMSVFAQHKKTKKWTFIGYVANNPNYIPEEGINNHALYDELGDVETCNGKVVEKIDVVFPYGTIATALVVEIILNK